MLLENGTKLVMVGDSVTDCGRARPVGEGHGEGLGRSYVAIVNGLIDFAYPDSRIRVVNMGVSGNTTRDLVRRWQTDVLDLKPDWVSIMIGINDVWRQYDSPLQTELHVYPDEYERNLETLVAQTLPAVKGMILISPYYMEPNPADQMRATMDVYGAAVRRVAQKHGLLFVDTQAMFNEKLTHVNANAIATDRVHPNGKGHILLAAAFLNAIGFEWKK